jgi:hypothetical protein
MRQRHARRNVQIAQHAGAGAGMCALGGRICARRFALRPVLVTECSATESRPMRSEGEVVGVESRDLPLLRPGQSARVLPLHEPCHTEGDRRSVLSILYLAVRPSALMGCQRTRRSWGARRLFSKAAHARAAVASWRRVPAPRPPLCNQFCSLVGQGPAPVAGWPQRCRQAPQLGRRPSEACSA